MERLRGLLWVLGAAAIIAAAMFIMGLADLQDRVLGVFLMAQAWLPTMMTLEQFLAMFALICFLIAAAAFGACLLMGARLSFLKQQGFSRTITADREIKLVKEQYQRQYTELLTIGQTLAKRLDKRVLVQAILDTASRLTSTGQANSVVSVWLLHVETDTIQFEKGLYCDETMFTQAEFQPSEPPFARVVVGQQAWLLPSWNDGVTFVRRDKASRLGAATSLMVVPLVIEGAVLGILVIFCHPDIFKSYEEQRPFYDTLWSQLGLGLAIAIQGEVTILDRLTGMLNREYLVKRLVQEIERSNRFQLPLSLLMIDIDNFKAVNDTLGHPQGDAVLKIVAKLIKKEVRAVDLVGRYGGEEFIVLLPETGYGEHSTSLTGALAVAERVRKSVDDEFRGLQKPLNLTISIGMAVRQFPEHRESNHQELIRLADEQLYRAKATGKNRVCALAPQPSQSMSS